MATKSNANRFLFVLVSGFMVLGYLVHLNLVLGLADERERQQNNETRDDQPSKLDGSSSRFLSQLRSSQTATQQIPTESVPRRTRIRESDVMPLLTKALDPVPDLVQPPLGPGTSRTDPTLQPLDTSYRGMDLSLPENEAVRDNRILYLITPTYTRKTQIVDLTRVGQTLRLAREGGYHRRIYWIILEDAAACTSRVRQMALESGVPFAHKAVQTSPAIRRQIKAHRGLEQRNTGMDIIVRELGAEGIVYFLDDDNAYNVQLFHELSYTTHVSVFGVGLPGGSAYERCVVDPKTGKVKRLLTNWEAPRTFAVDMAGFAFATHHLARTHAQGKPMRFNQTSRPGFLENDLILFAAQTVAELEPLAANCTRILAWHVKTIGNDLYYNPEERKNPKVFKLMVGLV